MGIKPFVKLLLSHLPMSSRGACDEGSFTIIEECYNSLLTLVLCGNDDFGVKNCTEQLL
ncbi:MAG: hypothetical protein ACOWWH_07850 [Eubacteriaceae bacterium]